MTQQVCCVCYLTGFVSSDKITRILTFLKLDCCRIWRKLLDTSFDALGNLRLSRHSNIASGHSRDTWKGACISINSTWVFGSCSKSTQSRWCWCNSVGKLTHLDNSAVWILPHPRQIFKSCKFWVWSVAEQYVSYLCRFCLNGSLELHCCFFVLSSSWRSRFTLGVHHLFSSSE